jgi:hypothetical protein
MILFLEWLEAGRTVRGNIHGGVTGARKTFGGLLSDICYLEGELCVSDNLEDSRRADEESELSSILIHTTLDRWRCQPQAFLKSRLIVLIEDRSIIITIFGGQNDAHICMDFG